MKREAIPLQNQGIKMCDEMAKKGLGKIIFPVGLTIDRHAQWAAVGVGLKAVFERYGTVSNMLPNQPERLNTYVRQTQEEERDGLSPQCSFACVRYFAAGLSTRINGAEWMALLYQAETSIVEMLSWALGWMEGNTGLLLLKLQTATWVK